MCSLKSPIDNKIAPVDGVIIDEYDNEIDLINGWIKLIRKTDPDIITGYNINSFDWNYINERCKKLNIELSLSYLSRLNDNPAVFKEERLVTNAYGENIFRYLYCYGMINSDLYTIIKREQKLESYKLDNVAKIHIGDQKDPLSPLDIFNKSKGNAEDVATVIKYCAKDTRLVIDLIKKLSIIPNIIAMSNVTWVPIPYIESRGQQIKVHSQLLYEARLNNYLVPTLPYKDSSPTDEEEKFTGATVLEAEPGAHFEQISGLDFASLYPSIMIANNYSYETMVKSEEFDNIEGVEYKDIIWKEDVGTDKERTEKVRFVQNRKGILPIMLEKLWTERKAIKKQMKVVKAQLSKETDDNVKADIEAEYSVLDGFQLAMKVSMNSIYGFTGANLGRLPEKRIAAAVTAEGRRMIKSCKTLVETRYDCKVVYGDSVTKYTPVFIKYNDKLDIVPIEELKKFYVGNKKQAWQSCIDSDKEYIEFDENRHNIETWTEQGWTKLKRVIRHKLHPSKKIVRIVTNSGVVDVTDDHSLLLEDLREISPKDVKIGDSLLHYNNPKVKINEITNCISLEEARIYGFFFNDGNCKSGNKPSWSLNNKDKNILNKYKVLCEQVYPEFIWKIYDRLNSSDVYKLSFTNSCNSSTNIMVKNYIRHCYIKNAKIIPNFIMNNKDVVQWAFLQGLYDSISNENTLENIKIDKKEQISASNVKWLLENLGYITTIDTINDNNNEEIYRISAASIPLNQNRKKIKKISEIDYEGYVYDLTTENNHFAAGVGNMVVHNTDSIYVKFFTEHHPDSKEHMDEVFDLSEKAADACSNLFKKPIELEFEKVMWPFILFSKKRYACVIWTNKEKHDYIDYKGIQVVRRDNCPLIKEKSKRIFETILLDRDIPKSIEMAREYSKNLLEGKYPIKELVISKSLKGYGSYEFDKQFVCLECDKRWYTLDSENKKKYSVIYWDNSKIDPNHIYKKDKPLEFNLKNFLKYEHYCYTCKKNTNYKTNKANIAHVALARKMQERDPYNCPLPGERVPYVFKKTSNKRDSQFEKVEDPDYLVRNCVPVDYEYYFEHQLKSALDTIFDPILKEEINEKLYKGIIEDKQKKTRKIQEVKAKKKELNKE